MGSVSKKLGRRFTKWSGQFRRSVKTVLIPKDVRDVGTLVKDGNAEDVGVALELMDTMVGRREKLFPDPSQDHRGLQVYHFLWSPHVGSEFSPDTETCLRRQAMPEDDAPISKTQAIRDYLADHPDAFPTTVAEALAARGIQVEPAHVAVVRTMLQPPKPDDEEPEEPPRHIHRGTLQGTDARNPGHCCLTNHRRCTMTFPKFRMAKESD